jgi:hypothetical protein
LLSPNDFLAEDNSPTHKGFTRMVPIRTLSDKGKNYEMAMALFYSRGGAPSLIMAYQGHNILIRYYTSK